MSTPPLPLPERPNLRHLKGQAKDLLRTGAATSLADAQFQIACRYGFASWPRLKAHVESLGEVGQLKDAIDQNDLGTVQALMVRNPELHRAPLGYGGNGPLTWVAECRVPWEPPTRARLAIAKWMIDHGSDVHQGGDGPLMRAAFVGLRIPMMELLLAHGADVNAEWSGYYPIIFAPCETLETDSLRWLLDHGARPNCARSGRKYPGTALDQVISTYARSPGQAACIDLLLERGALTQYDVPPVLALLRGRLDDLATLLERDPSLVHRRFPELDFGSTGYRRLALKNTTLLHVAAEYGNVEAARSLLARGADVNALAGMESGVGGQTPLFHAVSQFRDHGFGVAGLLLEHGADLSMRVTLPGHHERPEEFVTCTPLGYASLFPGEGSSPNTIALLRQHGAPE